MTSRSSSDVDQILGVSADNDWDTFVRFFAAGLEASAVKTRTQMLALVQVQTGMKEAVRRSSLRANTVVGQLVELGVLMQAGTAGHRRRFYAPSVLRVLTQGQSATP